MVAYSFSEPLASAVEAGSKRCTVRARGRRVHARPGDRLQLYFGMRTSACRKLVDPDPPCAGRDDVVMMLGSGKAPNVVLNGERLGRAGVLEFARLGGFTGEDPAAEMMDFYLGAHGRGRFEAVRIRW